MKPRFSFRWPLNQKLAGYFALVGILPLVIALAVGYRSSSTVLRASVGATLREVAILTADKVMRSSQYRRGVLDATVERLVSSGDDDFAAGQLGLLEGELGKSAPWVIGGMLRDADGRGLGSFGNADGPGGGAYVRPGVYWHPGLERVVAVDWVSVGDDHVLELISSGTDVMKVLAESSIPGRKVWIVDDHGVVVAGSGPAQPGEKADLGMISVLKSRDMGWATVRGEDTREGRPRLVGFAPVIEGANGRTGAHVGVVVEMDLAAAMGSMQLFSHLTTLTLVLTLALLVVSGFFWAERIVTPIRQLQTAFRLVGEGKLDERLDIRSGDELEDLAHGYNEMADSLTEYRGRMQERIERGEEELETKKRELVTTEEERDLSAAELGLLYAVSHAVLRSTDLRETLQTVVDSARIVMGAQTVVLYRSEGEGLRLEAAGPVDAGDNLDRPGPGSPAVVAAAEVRPVVKSVDDSADGAAIVYIPMLAENQVIGVIGFLAGADRSEWRASDVMRARNIAAQASVAINNARLHADLAERVDHLVASEGRFRALYEVGQALVSTLDPDTLMRQALEILETILGYETSAILLQDAECGDLYVQASRGHDPKMAENVRVELGSGICGRVAEVRESTIVHDLESIEGLQPFGLPDARSVLAVPIVHGGDLLGVLDVESREPGAYDEEDRDILKLFAAQVATAVKNARLFWEREQALEASQEAERLKTEFLANTSHELRTPLTSIIGFSEVLADRIPGPLNEKQEACVQDILGSGRHLLELINQILDLSRIESGRMEPSPDPVDLDLLLEEVAGTVSGLSSRRGLSLEWEVEPGLDTVVADRGMIKQVLVNLAGNALKFTPAGGRIDIAARAMLDKDRGRARDGRFRRGRWVEMSVTDTGVGISEEDQAVIFNEFRQVDGSFTREHQGSGLGLTLSKRFVELNRGMIWVESVVGSGASFRFLLPVQHVGDLPDAAEQVVDHRRTVLLVEDDLNSLKLLRRHLEQAGYDVLSATSGEKALALARRHRPRVIALDIMLPDMDGWSIMTHLRSFSETESIPVIITSVLDNPELGKGLGAVDYFTKPVDRPRFLERIASIGEWRPSRLLLATADSDLRARLQGLLDRPGWRLQMTTEALALPALVQEEHPDVVLLDLDLLGEPGSELMRGLGAGVGDIRIIAISSRPVAIPDRAEFPSIVEALVEKAPGMEDRVVSVLARLDDLRYGAVGGKK